MRNSPNPLTKQAIRKDLNLSQEVAIGATVELFSFQVPSGAKMEVTNFANYINVFEAWGLITWKFKRNGIPLYPYGEIKDQIAFGAPLRELSGVEINGGDRFSIDVINDHDAPVEVGIALNYEVS